jgi:ABC-type transport system substrate-binding protein
MTIRRKRNILILGMLLALFAAMSCGKNTNQGSSSQSSSSSQSTSSAQTTDSTQTTDNTQTTGTTQTTTAPTQEETSSTVTEDDGDSATEGTDAVADNWSPEMEKLRTAVVEALGDKYWPNAAISPEVLEGTYLVAPDLYEDYMGETPMISVNIDTLLIIKPKEGKAQDVEDALNDYRDAQLDSAAQYPRNLGKVQASRVEVIGDYVCFIELGADSAAGEEASSEAAVTKNDEQNEIAVVALEEAVK